VLEGIERHPDRAIANGMHVDLIAHSTILPEVVQIEQEAAPASEATVKRQAEQAERLRKKAAYWIAADSISTVAA
jgi:hypothetical protein